MASYDDQFVGVFEAQEDLTPREAYLRIAGELSSRGEFVPEKLQLYKLVLLRSARPPKGSKFVAGKLTEIGGRIRKGRGKPGAGSEGAEHPAEGDSDAAGSASAGASASGAGAAVPLNADDMIVVM